MYREIEEAVAFIAAYFYYKLPRNQVDRFAVKLANILLNKCRKIIKADESKISKEKKNEKSNSESLTREMIMDINVDGKLAVAIVEASSVFKMTLQQISALLPNAVQLHINEGMVSYSFRSNLICLYRSDGNMYHLHRRAHHTHLRPPITTVTDQDDCKIFKLITKNTFPLRRYCHKKNYDIVNNTTKLRKVMKSAYFRRNNQQLPGPIRSAKLSGNGFMHPSLPFGYGRKWKEMEGRQEMMSRKSRNKKKIRHSRSNKKQSLNAEPTMEKFSSNRQNKADYIKQKSSKNSERSSTLVTDDILRSFGVLASDYSRRINRRNYEDVSSLTAYMNNSLNI
ncbi:BTG family protein, partial [Onchocerca flexuosa]